MSEEIKEDKEDEINHPKHYTKGKIEVISIIEYTLSPIEFKGFLKGSIIKYIARENYKGHLSDIKKAEWYAKKLAHLGREVIADAER
jgi:hypothetical protein